MIERLALIALGAAFGMVASAPAAAADLLDLDPYAIVPVRVGHAGADLVFPVEPTEVVSANLVDFPVRVDGVSVHVLARSGVRAGVTSELFVVVSGVTCNVELEADPKADARTFEFSGPRAFRGAPIALAIAPAAEDAGADAPAIVFADPGAARMPMLALAPGHITRLELPDEPVNYSLADPELFSVELRGRDLYVAAAAGCAAGSRSRLVVWLDGGDTLDFELRLATYHSRIVVVRAPAAAGRTRDGRAILKRQ